MSLVILLNSNFILEPIFIVFSDFYRFLTHYYNQNENEKGLKNRCFTHFIRKQYQHYIPQFRFTVQIYLLFCSKFNAYRVEDLHIVINQIEIALEEKKNCKQWNILFYIRAF